MESLASWSLIFFLLQSSLVCTNGRGIRRETYGHPIQVDSHLWITNTKQMQDMHVEDMMSNEEEIRAQDGVDDEVVHLRMPQKHTQDDHPSAHMDDHIHDPSLHLFFTPNDLKIGKKLKIYFPNKDPSKSPRFLPREEANSIPFSSTNLLDLLNSFSFPKDSPQAKAMDYTLKECELEPIKGETKFCADSLESMLDKTQQMFGPNTEYKVLTTNYIYKKENSTPLQNYTIIDVPKQIDAPKMIGCHIMPYPYTVYYCHGQFESQNKVFEISLESENGERVEAVGVCHMDTSLWDRDHVSFRVLSIEPGSSPVCHFFPVDNLVWVPI